jgi:hypothetical protein
MKHIQYSDIPEGTFGYFYVKDNTHPETLQAYDWVPGRFIFQDLGILEVPQEEYLFDSVLHLQLFLTEKLKRNGYYLIAHRGNKENDTFIKLYNKELDKYHSCFGIAYSSEPFYVKPRYYQDKKIALPNWLKTINQKQYHISH